MSLAELRHLIESIGFQPAAATQDLHICLESRDSLYDDDASRLSFTRTHTGFQNWILDPLLSSLYIEGEMCDDVAFSAFSTLCAEMTSLLQVVPCTITLSHFCGLHVYNPDTPFPDVRGMMISLIGQLLTQWDNAFQIPEIDKFQRQEIAAADLRTLCDAFRSLILNIPPEWTVYCVIDGVDIYETPDRRKRTLKAIKRLRLLVSDCGGGEESAVFKLLVTALSLNGFVGSMFEEDENITVDDFVERSEVMDVSLEDVLGLS